MPSRDGDLYTGEAKRAWPKRSGGNPACPVVWGAVRFRHLLDSALGFGLAETNL